MTDRAAFAKLVRTLAPLGDRPLTTLDADVAFAEREKLEGSIKDRLLEAGFKEQLTGNHNPPVSQYTLGDDDAGGFYAEFLTPLTGSGRTRQGEPLATVKNAGVTAQRLRYLDLLLKSPWNVTLRKLPRQADISKVELSACRMRYSAGVSPPRESWGLSSL